MTTSRGRVLPWPGAVCALLLCAGCFKSYVAVSFQARGAVAGEPAVVAPATHAEARGAVKVVAVRAPWACTGDAPPARLDAGVAATSRVILGSRCSVWLPELERALAGAGYQVIPWRDLLATEAAEGAVHLAALKLGADAVMALVGLEARPLLVAGSEVDALSLWSSDADGALLGPSRLEAGSRRVILGFVKDRYRDGAVAGFTADVDAAAIMAATAEPIWSYRRTVAGDLAGCGEPRMLLRGRSTAWRPVLPAHPSAPPAADAGEPGEDPLVGRLRATARSVMTDLVDRFRKGG